LLNLPDLQRQSLQLTERTERFGLVVDLVLQRRGERYIELRDGEKHDDPAS
jgi:hypothetical protein